MYSGIGTPGTTMSPSANPAWIPELSAEDTYDFDLEKSKQILEDAATRTRTATDPRVRGREHRPALRDP